MLPSLIKKDVKMSETPLTQDDASIHRSKMQKAVVKHKLNFIVLCAIGVLISAICSVYYEAKQYELLSLMAKHNSIMMEQMKFLMELSRKFGNLLDESQSKLNKSMKSVECALIPVASRFDCHPENDASELACIDRGCCWHVLSKQETSQSSSNVHMNIPYCYYPRNWSIYKYVNFTKTGSDFMGFQVNHKRSVYLKDIKLIRMDATSIDKTTLRVKVSDAENTRYEPYLPVRPDPRPFENSVTNTDYSLEVEQSSPGFRVRRSSDKTAIFDSIGKGGFIFADQLLQISTVLNTSNLYGLGEHRDKFKLDMNWQTLTMFNKDQPPMENANLYGTHPFYLVIEESGNCHGVLFINSNAMDVILQPTPALTFRTIGGIFDMYFFMGPTPADVVRQYSEIVGKPFMPPYWSLGFHLCRFGYGSLNKTKEVWNRTRAAGIPFDTQWNDLDYMLDNNDFTYNADKFKGLPEFLQELAAVGMHYIPLIDAGISASEPKGSYGPFDEGIRRDIFIKDGSSGLPFKGKVWNRKSTVWPDFTHPDAADYWYDMMNEMWHMFPYDGAWIDMNEPSNFYNGHVDGCITNNLDNPPYTPNVIGKLLATKTLCMNAKFHNGSHYDVHNTYGTSEAVATHRALQKIRGRRPFIISRSTWLGHGKYAGHWAGDNFATWHDMKMSISQLLSFSLFQIPMMGSDICGFNGNTTEPLCNRWMQLGAFYPFSRNHNSDDTTEQDPVALGETVVKSSRKALMIRYRFLPYLYTLFYRAHIYGDTVARPLFFEFTNDPSTYDVDTQFLWGSALMVVPVLEEGTNRVVVYIPRGTWYDFYNKKTIVSTGKTYTFDEVPIDTIPLFVRGGYILPAQTPSSTTTASRKNDFELLIGPDDSGKAKGELYWDDGEDLTTGWRCNFTLENRIVTGTKGQPGSNASEKLILGKVQVMGVANNVSKVSINGKEIDFKYEKDRSYLIVKGLNVDLKNGFTLSWQ